MSIATSSTSETGNDFNDGTASAAAFGGTPGYSYLWSTGGTTPTINNLAPGDYSVTASDANGCTIVSSVTVSSFDCGTLEPAVNGITSICPGSSSGSLEITTIVGGAAPFSFDWSTGSTDNHIEQLSEELMDVPSPMQRVANRYFHLTSLKKIRKLRYW